MKTVGVVFRKELARVFFDKKMIFSLFILPVLIMAVMFGVMGYMFSSMQEDVDEHIPTVMLYQAPDAVQTMFKASSQACDLVTTDDNKEVEKAKKDILNGDLDVLVTFGDDFEDQIQSYKEGDAIPEVKTYYNPSEDYSSTARTGIVDQYLEQYRQGLLAERIGDMNSITIFSVDSTNPDSSIIQDEDKATGKKLAMIVPYMMTLLLFAGVMSLGVDTVVGEKERGTIATMLVTPVKRSHIVYGKLLALMVISALSASIYAVSTIVGMPLYMKSMGEGDANLTLSFSGMQILMMLGIIISQVFSYVAIICFCSVFAKTIKEGSTYVMPAYMLVIVFGMMTMYVSGDTPLTSYAVPIYGASMALRNILTQEITGMGCLIAVGMNLLIGIVLAVVITKAYNSERVMFDA